ncbi:urease accessory protein UreD [Sporosarcina sp. FSL K6-2383]|uniref:urease accessory protein UreD n=1 Tax=Sporosarcina sp. FSL K6-2383 TaxID=2921556 RepID=UPI00315A4F3A
MAFELRRGYTRMPHVYQQPPLKASRELYEGKDPTATVYIMESSGGMVSGDRNDITVKLGPDSRVRLTQQSALKIYPSHTGDTCHFTIEVDLAERSRLEWMPEVLIPFVDAKFQVNTTLRVACDATVLWGEIVAPGREKRGEIFDYQSFRSNFKIFVEDELIAFDSLHFAPRDAELGGIGLLEGAMYVGSIWLVSPNVVNVDVRALQETLRVEEGLKAGMTRLEGNAIHCRWLAVDQWKMQEEMKRVYALLAGMV